MVMMMMMKGILTVAGYTELWAVNNFTLFYKLQHSKAFSKIYMVLRQKCINLVDSVDLEQAVLHFRLEIYLISSLNGTKSMF